MATDERFDGLRSWLAEQLDDDVRIEGLSHVDFGHSAETLVFTVVRGSGGDEGRDDVVLRLRPPPPGLLEPYDLRQQFEILRAIESTPVIAPRALWYEGTGDVLGREFYVMERLPGTVYEREMPPELHDDPPRVRRMCDGMVEQLAAIHGVDLHATGLDALGDGRDHLERELDRWTGEMRRVQRGELPALERLAEVVRDRRPEQSERVALVHGDPKQGNVAFDERGEVTAVFDWELATIGDPLADVGWLDFLWDLGGSFTNLPGALSADEFIANYEARTGITVEHREWYRGFQGFKMAVILLVGAMHYDQGLTDDPRVGMLGLGVSYLTNLAFAALGIEESLDHGPVMPRTERLEALGLAIASNVRSDPL